MLSPSEQMLYASVRIAALENGEPSSFGTGFFYECRCQGGILQLLVTNKHVIEDVRQIGVQVHVAAAGGVAAPSGRTELVTIQLEKGGIIDHPDSDVDLCAISIGNLTQPGALRGQNMFAVNLNADLIPRDDEWPTYDALEEVLMVGCPDGLYDETNGLPIMRRGTTATHPAFPYEGRAEFMIDAACFPGSSGSPVYLHNMLGHYNKQRGGMDIGSARVKLLGVLFAGPTINQDGKIVLTKEPDVEVEAMMHLGTVLRSSRLRELEAAACARGRRA